MAGSKFRDSPPGGINPLARDPIIRQDASDAAPNLSGADYYHASLSGIYVVIEEISVPSAGRFVGAEQIAATGKPQVVGEDEFANPAGHVPNGVS